MLPSETLVNDSEKNQCLVETYGNWSSNPCLTGSMLIYWRVDKMSQTKSVFSQLKCRKILQSQTHRQNMWQIRIVHTRLHIVLWQWLPVECHLICHFVCKDMCQDKCWQKGGWQVRTRLRPLLVGIPPSNVMIFTKWSCLHSSTLSFFEGRFVVPWVAKFEPSNL